MKRLVVWLAVGLAVVALGWTIADAPAPAHAQQPPPEPEGITYAIHGGGWGHGTGMSQFGAYGMGLEGRSWTEILGWYFTNIGTGQLGVDVPDPGILWVGLSQHRSSAVFDVHATAPDGSGYVVISRPTADGGTEQVTILNKNSIVVSFRDGGCALTISGLSPDPWWGPGSCALDFTWDGWTAIDPTTQIVIDGDRTYTYGDLRIRPNKPIGTAPTGFHITHVVDLERYLWGLAEVPYSWAFSTLEAQAVAGRSYAVNKMTLRGHPDTSTIQQSLCWCHVYNTTRDQVYIGTNFRAGVESWKEAVASTESMVMTHESEVFNNDPLAVATFYSSSTFGHTEDSGVAFGSGSTPEYLKGVPDPWSIAPTVNNRNARWTKTLSEDAIANAVGLESLTDIRIDSYRRAGTQYQTAKQVSFVGLINGASATRSFDSRELRSKLGLLSMQIVSIEKRGVVGGGAADAIAGHDPVTGLWHLLRPDGSVNSFYYGDPGDRPMACDWDGSGTDTVGLYRQHTGFLYLRQTNTFGVADISIFYGIPEDQPICGDWNGDGNETIGIYRPSERRFYLRNSNTQGFADMDLVFDADGTVPLAGDWNGDGKDTVGLFNPTTEMLYLTYSLQTPTIDIAFHYEGSNPGDRIVAGDWNGDGVDSIGVFRPSNGTFYLRDTYTQSGANHTIKFGLDRYNPVSGAWD